jgi:diguanylate cyclase (GGDEF)-like protein
MLMVTAFFSILISLLAFVGLHDIGLKQAIIDFAYGVMMISFIFILRISKQHFKKIAYFLLSMTFLLFTYILVYLPTNEARTIWFFLLIVFAYIVTDSKGGLIYTTLSVGIIIVLHVVSDLHLSQISINASIIALLASSAMFWSHAKIITQYQTNLKQKNNSLSLLASTDYLTGIMNKRMFSELSKRYFKTAQRDGFKLTLFVLDLDHFKNINDTYGHQAGDKLLKYFVQTVENTLRASDIFARIGGEEFAILVSKMHKDDALIFAEKIRNTIEGLMIEYEGHYLSVTTSIGISQSHKTDNEFDDILFRADMALYKAKNEGRNRISCIRAKDSVLKYPKADEENTYLHFSI